MIEVKGMRTVSIASTTCCFIIMGKEYSYKRLIFNVFAMGMLSYSLHHWIYLDCEFGTIIESIRYQIPQSSFTRSPTFKSYQICGKGHRESSLRC